MALLPPEKKKIGMSISFFSFPSELNTKPLVSSLFALEGLKGWDIPFFFFLPFLLRAGKGIPSLPFSFTPKTLSDSPLIELPPHDG